MAASKSSITKKYFYAPSPNTVRGQPVLLGGDPKGKNVVYCVGNQVVMRNIQDPRECDVYTEHSYPTTVARYSPSGFYIASCDSTGMIRIWDTVNETHICKLETRALAGPVKDLAWSEDSKRIAVVGDGKGKFGSFFFWDSGASVGEVSGHSKCINSVDFKPCRPYRAITASEDLSVTFYEGPPFKYKKSIKEHQRWANCVRFSPNGNHFVTVGADKQGFLYDGKTSDKVSQLSTDKADAHTGSIYACSWSPDSARLLTVSADKSAKIWDIETTKCVTTFTFGKDVEDQQVGCLWQGDYLLSLSLGGSFSYLDVNNPAKPTNILHGHNKIINSLAYDPTSKAVYTSSLFAQSTDTKILRWNLDNAGNAFPEGKGHQNQCNGMNVSNGVLYSIGWDDTFRATPLETYQYGDSVKTDGQPQAVGTNGTTSVVATNSSLNLFKGNQKAGTVAIKYKGTAVGIDTAGTTAAVGGDNKLITLYNISGDSLSENKTLEGHRGEVTSISYSPDGKWMVSCDSAREIFLWDTATYTIKQRDLTYHQAKPVEVAWAPDSQHFASVAIDQNILVWDLNGSTNRIEHKLAHQSGCTHCIWLDNNTLATTGQDCFLKTWTIAF